VGVGVRVVSLLPSVTETLRAWGIDPVACTRFCEQPDLPTVGGTKDPDVAAIVALQPDLVVVDEEENRREDADALGAAGVRVLATAVRSVGDVAPALRALADAVGLAAVDVPDGAPTADGNKERRAFVPIWRRPWMTISADTYGSSLLAGIGVVNVYGDALARYPEVDLDDARGRAPDLVVAPSEPYPFTTRHEAELAAVAPVRFVDGRDLFWWGVRTAGAVGRLLAQLDD
jgi:ABC-type Fe3+-hydroxamate transport system substrate-binding protein